MEVKGRWGIHKMARQGSVGIKKIFCNWTVSISTSRCDAVLQFCKMLPLGKTEHRVKCSVYIITYI